MCETKTSHARSFARRRCITRDYILPPRLEVLNALDLGCSVSDALSTKQHYCDYRNHDYHLLLSVVVVSSVLRESVGYCG